MNTKTSLVLLLLATVLTVAGCSGVPFSTLWHFRNFGPRDLLKTDPAMIRAAVQVKDGVNVDTRTAALDVQIAFANEAPRKFSLPLVMLRKGPWVGAGTGKAEHGKHWYLFALSPEGVQSFRGMQQYLGRHLDDKGQFKQHGKVNVSVSSGRFHLNDATTQRVKDSHELFMQVRLELSPRDGFYTLYKGTIPVTAKDLKAMSEQE